MIWQWAATVFVPSAFVSYCAASGNHPYPWNDDTLDKIEVASGFLAVGSGLVAVIAFIWSFGP